MIAEDGSVVYGRTMEWGAFDLNSRVAITPRGYKFKATLPEGLSGLEWESKYGIVAMDMLMQDHIADGMNEMGLAVGMFYHPGFAEYQEYDPKTIKKTISSYDVPN